MSLRVFEPTCRRVERAWLAVGGWRLAGDRRTPTPRQLDASPTRRLDGFSSPGRNDSKTGRLVTAMAMVVLLAYGCRTTVPVPPPVSEVMRGVASWYGEEFAGRTTANGEIFDPALLTAAHRTLPFGSVLEVTNQKTKQTVRVRVNDRGPYIAGRALDLSYAAAERIGLIEPGIGEVEFLLVRVGSGDREPPMPFEAVVDATPQTVPNAAAGKRPAQRTPAPIVPPPPAETVPNVEPVVVDRVEVQVERGGVVTRTQVAADGRTLEEVPVEGGAAIPRAPAPAGRESVAARPGRPPETAARKQFIVQVGAFSVEANAKSLQERLAAIGQSAHIDRNTLFRVRLGPFATRDQAAAARATLEANGLSAIIVRE